MIFLWLEKRVPLWKKSGKMQSATSNTYALKDEVDMQLSELKKNPIPLYRRTEFLAVNVDF